MGVDAAFINQDLKAPVHPIVAVDKRFCHNHPISVLIPQDILQDPNHGAIYEVAKDEFGQHSVSNHNKHNKDDKTSHDPSHGAVHNIVQKVTGHDKHDKIGQNEIRHNELPIGGAHGYHGTHGVDQNENQVGYDKTQHTGVRNAIHDAVHGTDRNEFNEFGHNETQHGDTHEQTHGPAYGVGQTVSSHSEFDQYELGHNESGHGDLSRGGVDLSAHAVHPNEFGLNDIRQGAVRQPTHGESHGIDQDVTGHNESRHGGLGERTYGVLHGVGEFGHNKTGKQEKRGFGKHGLSKDDFLGKAGRGPLMFNLTHTALNDRDNHVLKDANGKPIVYLAEKNRIIQRNFVVTRDADGEDKMFDVKRKHLSKSPVRADFDDLASGRSCRLGAAVLEESHGITALLWLDVGDGKKEKLPVGRLHLPSGSHTDPNVARAADNHHKVTDAVHPVTKQHKDSDGRLGKDYQLDLMPGIDVSLAVLVGMVTVACADHKRPDDDNAGF
ncbi:hypothetical protein Poli38472_010019 [Pythium oligandrum]|uniref:Uncharacterized protein n=1 Tax=Pythium oligandrum TaxID=41045 RepID=A0A8K1C8X8_PYTOL|nr:hypothetical protein Poli38472_010019 [Pythium oligandrum]|eukprot:TMW58460.1 hypothetical protein Poli38472_010019 [Pythium oligandrum]